MGSLLGTRKVPVSNIGLIQFIEVIKITIFSFVYREFNLMKTYAEEAVVSAMIL